MFFIVSLKNSFFVWFFSSVLEPPSDDETAIFLHGQEKIWKGLINMQSVAKFVTKAYLVSGSFEHLKEVSLDGVKPLNRRFPSIKGGRVRLKYG